MIGITSAELYYFWLFRDATKFKISIITVVVVMMIIMINDEETLYEARLGYFKEQNFDF